VKKLLRIIKGEDQGYYDLAIDAEIPRKGDSVAFRTKPYTVSWVEYDYDSSTVCVVCI